MKEHTLNSYIWTFLCCSNTDSIQGQWIAHSIGDLDHDNSFYDSSKTRRYIQQAFDDWASHTQLTFREVTSHKKADFNLAFVYGNHGDGYPFDGRDGVLAHAFIPGTATMDKFILIQPKMVTNTWVDTLLFFDRSVA